MSYHDEVYKMKFANIFSNDVLNDKYGFDTKALEENAGYVNYSYDTDYFSNVLDTELKSVITDSTIQVCVISAKDHYQCFPQGTIFMREGYGGVFTVHENQPWILVNAELFDGDAVFVDMSIRHELVHYQQWIDNRIFFCDEGIVWEGEFYSREFLDGEYVASFSDAQWKILPWETEAYSAMFTDEQINKMLRVLPIGLERSNLLELLTVTNRTHLIK